MKTVKNVRHKFPQLKMTSLNVRLTVQNPKIINLESYLNRGEQNSWNASRLTETDWGMFWRLTAVPVDPHFSRLQPTLFTFFRSTWFHSFCYLTRWVVLFWLFWFCMFCHIVLRLHWLSSPVVLSHRFWRLVLRWCCPDVWFCPPHPELHWLCSPTSLQLFQVLSSSCWFCHSVLCCGGFGLTLLVSFCRVLQVLLFLQWCPLGLWFCPLHLELHWLCSWMILFCRLGSVVVLFSRFCPLVAGSVLWLFCGSLVFHLQCVLSDSRRTEAAVDVVSVRREPADSVTDLFGSITVWQASSRVCPSVSLRCFHSAGPTFFSFVCSVPQQRTRNKNNLNMFYLFYIVPLFWTEPVFSR